MKKAANNPGSFDPGLDLYIARAPQLAQPILTHLRELVHKASPPIEESIEWSRPFFLHRGVMLANMGALHAKPVAKANFEKLSPSCRREYIEWIVEAKRQETQEKRIAKTVEQVGEGEGLKLKVGVAAQSFSFGGGPLIRDSTANGWGTRLRWLGGDGALW